MTTQKTYLTVHFFEGDAQIEATLNYSEKSWSLTHSNNDNNVTFTSKYGKTPDESMKTHLDRAKCVVAALKYIKQELNVE